jgi:hypothetical protein
MRSDEINELAAALAKAQGQMGNAVMNRVNPHFRSKYADLGSVFVAVRKALSENGIAVTQMINNNNLCTMLIHTSGQYLGSEMALPVTAKAQEMGSYLTYARRYSLSSLAGVAADDDDDGNLAAKPNGKAETSAPVSIEQLGHIQQALVKNGIDISWLIEFANKRNIPIARLEEIPASMFEKFLTAIKSKAVQNERPVETDPKHS